MFWVLAAVLVGLGALVLNRVLRRAPDYVYVEDDGSVRDLTADDQAYLDQEFLPNDGGRPYIKASYRSRTPSGSLGGFLERQKVPKDLRPR